MQKTETQKIPNVMFRLKSENKEPVGIVLGVNLFTGAPLMGDKIEDQASGRTFTVVDRTWLNGDDRKANIAITLVEEPAAPHE